MSQASGSTVVVPVRNGASTIADTLRSLLAQRGGAPGELIVVDNGSTDDTAAIVRAFPVTLLFESTPGAAAARNAGLRAANGDVVAFCDADTVVDRRWLGELLAAFDDPGVTLAAGQIVCYPPKTGAERYLATCGVYDVERASRRTPFPLAPSGNMAVRRAAALAIGGFDEAMITAEDADFSHRILVAFPGAIAYRGSARLFHQSRPGDDALRRQAYVYGEGVARLYRRYPKLLPWRPAYWITMSWHIVTRTLFAVVAPALRALRIVTSVQAEFARYHRMWTVSFWRGFLHWYYANRRFAETPPRLGATTS